MPIEFIEAIFAEWVSGVTGGLSAPLFIWALIGSGTPRVASGTLAIVCFYVAAYRVWHRERVALQGERARNSMPEIRGELFDFSVSTYGRGHDNGVWRSHARVRFSVAVCNYRDVQTNIVRLEIDGRKTKPESSVTNVDLSVPGRSFDELALPPTTLELRRGMQVYMVGTVFIDVNLDPQAEPLRLDLTKLRPFVVDGFGNVHQLSVRSGETVDFLGA